MPTNQQVIVAMIDGLDPRYATEAVMPNLTNLGASGFTTIVEAVAPSVTNTNNAGIACASWPAEHGITGNYYYEPVTGEQGYMEDSSYLLRPTLMSRVTDAGGKAALLTAKKKTVGLLGDRTTLAVAAEAPPEDFVERYGPAPDIYSAEINHWLWTVAIDLLHRHPDLDLLYVHTTDFPMHMWAPGDPRSDAHLRRMDELIAGAIAAAPDAAFFATADHGMNGKDLVWDLNQALANRDAPVKRALSAEKDKYVRHHRTFGGTAWIWLDDPGDADRVVAATLGLRGVEDVLSRETAAARFHLHPDRIGDLVVLGDELTVFGDLTTGESEHLPDGYRTHGSLHESGVPLISYNSADLPFAQPPRANKDLLTPLLDGWLVE